MAEPKLRFKKDDGTEYCPWEITLMEDICEPHARIGWQNLRTDEFLDEGDYYLVTGTDFKNGKVDFDTCHYVSKERFEQDPKIQIHEGDILITKDGTLGKIAMVKGIDKEGTLNAGVFVLTKLSEEIDNEYLYQYLRGDALLKFAQRKKTGGTIKHLNQEVLVILPVPKPDKEEQKKIAEFLASVDELIATSEEEITNLEQQKKAAMQAIFSRKVRFKKPDGSDFPEWEEKTFDAIAKYKKGPFGSALKKEIFVPKSEDTVRVYEQTNAIDKTILFERYYITKEYFQKMKGFEVTSGDIIVSCAGTIGEMYVLPENAENGVINQALMRVRVDESEVTKTIFMYVFDEMLSTNGTRLKNGSAMKNIPPFADMKKQTVLLPHKDEQLLIENFMLSFDEAIAAAREELEKYKELKKGLLQQMFV